MPGGFEAGERFGDFEIIEVAGRGGMGVVYRARQITLERVVALKVISPEIADAPDFTDRFRRESRLAASIDHPHVVSIFGAGEQEGQAFISMQWVDGTSLDQLVSGGSSLAEERTRTIISQLAAALDVAHANGLVHRDVKPPNVLVRSIAGADHAYLTDFGIARRVDVGATGLTKTGQTIGTVGYMAPEQIRGEKGDGRADLYSLGCVLYQCLTGRRPFEHETEVAVMFAHVNEERPRPSAVRPDLAPYDELILRTLALEPDDRFQTGAELAAALRAAGGAGGGPPPAGATVVSADRPADETRTGRTAVLDQTPPPPPPPRRPAREEYEAPPPPPAGGGSGRKRLLIGIGVVALVLAIGFGAFAATGGLDSTGTTTVLSDPTADSTSTDTSVDDGTDDGGGGGNGGLGGAGEPDEDADIADIQSTLDDYQVAYNNKDTDALAALFTPDVFRRGYGANEECVESNGLAEVLSSYQGQFPTGSYTLTDTSEGAIDLSGDSASLDTDYTITSLPGGSISFELERSGSDWLISRVEAECS